MPANTKYLIKSRWTRTSKFLAAFLGGIAAIGFMVLALSVWINLGALMITAPFVSLILWSFLALMVYQIKKAWVSWVILLGITLISLMVFYLGKS